MNDQNTRQTEFQTEHQIEHRLDELLAGVRAHAWTGPDHSTRVDSFLQEQAMRQDTKRHLSRTTIALIIAGVVGGGAVAAAVTHEIMSYRAKIIADDGTEYNVELAPTPEGAAGTFVTEDGTVYGINMAEDGAGQRSVTVDVDSAVGGTSTVILPDGSSPSVLVAPGQKATIHMGTAPTGAKFIDENGVEHEVPLDAADNWTSDEGSETTGG